MDTPFPRPEDGGPVLAVLEAGRLRTIPLARREKWTLGRKTSQNQPDIPLTSKIAGRKHGEFFVIDGLWFYCDRGSRNGTLRGGRRLKPGLGGRAAPVMLRDGDALCIDCLPGGDPRGVLLLFLAGGLREGWSFRSLEGRTRLSIGQAALELTAGRWRLSGTGVRLNGTPLEAPALLSERDCFLSGPFCGIFTGSGLYCTNRGEGKL